MKAFHDDSEIKEKYLARVRSHRAADELIRGEGWDGHRGCAIGCTLEAYDHSRYPIELGIPEQLAYLEDWLFERLPVDDSNWTRPGVVAMAWPELVLSSIHVGSDLSRVWPEFAIWLLVDPAHGVLQYAVDISVRAAIVDVADLYRRTDDVSQDEWAAARLVAWAAREAAREAAAAETAAANAANAADAAWAAWAAREAAWTAWAARAATYAERAARAGTDIEDVRSAAHSMRAAPETWTKAAAAKFITLLESA
jgi:hypothetical protein